MNEEGRGEMSLEMRDERIQRFIGRHEQMTPSGQVIHRQPDHDGRLAGIWRNGNDGLDESLDYSGCVCLLLVI